METTITATELARSLSDILNRVRYKKERFVVQRHGETIATLAPPEPQRGVMLHEALEELARRNISFPGDGFADDVEAAQAAQTESEFPDWPS
jgi:antitoxin (DNA-binding transcriptional repressor) of toxin-antitoxin stability system